MSEQHHQGYYDKQFDAVTSDLEGDLAFARAIEATEVQLDELAISSLFAAQAETTDPRGPYFVRPLQDEMTSIVTGFYEACDETRLDLMRPNLLPHDLEAIQEQVRLRILALREKLQIGDTVSVSNALIIDMDDDEEGSDGVITVTDDQRVQGTFITSAIGVMPDDFYAAAHMRSEQAPLGVGLMISDPVVVDARGERHSNVFSGKRVIIVLGTLGLKMDKLYYQSDEVFTTPPDDNSDH